MAKCSTAALFMASLCLITPAHSFLTNSFALRLPPQTKMQAVHPLALQMTAVAPKSSTFRLNLAGDTTLLLNQFDLSAATDLGNSVNGLIGTFKVLKDLESKGAKREIQPSFSYSWSQGENELTMECNPNLFPNAFGAKVFVTFSDPHAKVSSQVSLPDLVDTLKVFKSSFK